MRRKARAATGLWEGSVLGPSILDLLIDRGTAVRMFVSVSQGKESHG